MTKKEIEKRINAARERLQRGNPYTTTPAGIVAAVAEVMAEQQAEIEAHIAAEFDRWGLDG